MLLIDTHAHIYLPQFERDRGAVIERAAAAGVEAILLPAIDSATHELVLQLEAEYPQCRAMMGLHPCSVDGNWEKELEVVEGYLARRNFLAIGEIGLDFYWDKQYTEQQYAAFHRQIRLALERNLPIVIHSREATDECTAVVEQYPGLRGVFHCFSGTEEQARRILATGFYLGIGGVATFKKAGLDAVVAAVGLERVVLETDAPYLAPVPYRGKRNEPAYTALVAQQLALACGVEVEAVAAQTTANAKNLFGLP
jgi:TatD DNase family protein